MSQSLSGRPEEPAREPRRERKPGLRVGVVPRIEAATAAAISVGTKYGY